MRNTFTTANTPEARKTAAANVHKRAMENVIYIPLGSYKIPTATRKTVSGLVKSPAPVFWNIKLAKD